MIRPMKPQLLFRRVHYWASIPIVLPLLVVIATGIALQLKKHWTFVQPPEQQGSGAPALCLTRILEICQTIPLAEIGGWEDVHRVELRPARGVVKVVSKNSMEVQIDAHDGDVLQVAMRRSDLIESLHDGSWFHERAKLGVFLPAAVVLFVLLLTGVYLFVLPYWARWKRSRMMRRG
jgi:uncharacterized iron-regulated membrane protein